MDIYIKIIRKVVLPMEVKTVHMIVVEYVGWEQV